MSDQRDQVENQTKEEERQREQDRLPEGSTGGNRLPDRAGRGQRLWEGNGLILLLVGTRSFPKEFGLVRSREEEDRLEVVGPSHEASGGAEALALALAVEEVRIGVEGSGAYSGVRNVVEVDAPEEVHDLMMIRL